MQGILRSECCAKRIDLGRHWRRCLVAETNKQEQHESDQERRHRGEKHRVDVTIEIGARAHCSEVGRVRDRRELVAERRAAHNHAGNYGQGNAERFAKADENDAECANRAP